MVWSFVYLALCRLCELMVLCWRSADAKEVEILVLRHPADSPAPPAPTASAPAPGPCAACRPEPPPAQAPMVDLRGHTRDAASMAPAHGAPTLDLSNPATRPTADSRSATELDRAAGQREPTVGRPAHPQGAAGPWLPGLRQLHRQGFCAPTASRGERPSRRWHPLIRPSRNCTGAGVVRAWSARPGCHWTTTGRIRRFLGQAVTDGLLF